MSEGKYRSYGQNVNDCAKLDLSYDTVWLYLLFFFSAMHFAISLS
jgi:hypothetical protein